MKTHESKTCLVHAYHPITTIVLQQLPSYSNYSHAITTILQHLL
jgi:hypothetical protein